MFTIEFIAPYQNLVASIEEAFAEHPKRNEIKHVVNFKGVPEIRGSELVGDIFIARGLTANYLHRLWKDATVIELPMSGYDIMRAMSAGIEEYGAKRIALIATANAIYGVDNFSPSFLPPIMTYEIGPLDDPDPIIERAVSDGADLIIGGNNVTLRAKELGHRATRIDMGKESVRQAIDEAWRLWHSNMEERVRVQRLNALVENVHEGVISVDHKNCVTICNHYAQRLLDLPSDQIYNRPLGELLPELEGDEIQEMKKPGIGELLTLGSTEVVINRVPVHVDGMFITGIITMQEASEIRKIESRIRREAHQKGLVATYDFSQMIGNSPAFLATKRLALSYAPVQSNVLIVGETGTGKELFAQSIHRASSRHGGPFVAVNCAALPESLLESELFGYVGGAFTGASKSGKMGLFELAHCGTIFLDEISEMSLHLQGRLLRVIEEREIMRLGHDTVMPVDIRIIAATNQSLEALVAEGSFRQDLFYRLDVLRLNIPPLRERDADVLLLAQQFLRQFDDQHRRSRHMLDPDVGPLLEQQRWEGNIRQLRNLCERLSVVIADTVITKEDLATCLGPTSICAEHIPLSDDEERSALILHLERTGGNKSAAARSLGIDRSTLYRRLRKHNLL